MQDIIKILKNYKLNKKLFFIYVFLFIVIELIIISFPLIWKNLMHILETKWDFQDVLFWWFLWMFLILLAVLLWYVGWRLTAKIRWIIFYKKDLYYRKKLLDKDYSYIIDEWSGKLVSKFSRWAQAEADIFISIFHIITNPVLKTIVIFWIFIYFLPWFVILLLVFIFSMYLLNSYISKKIKYYTEKENRLYEESTKLMVKIIDNFTTVKLFNKKELELKKSEQILKQHPYLREKIRSYQILFYNLLFWFIKTLEYGSYIVIWYFILQWESSIALLVMVIGYLGILWNPVEVAINEINRLNQQLQVYRNLQDFLNKKDSIKNGYKIFEYKEGKIEIKNLDFAYGDRKIFEKLNLNFLAWKKNALVWHSGWWKSTIVKLILRLYEYKNWKILIDSQDLKSLKIESFYKYVWYLPQQAEIFDGTIRENLLYALDEVEYQEDKKTNQDDCLRWFQDNEKEEKMWEALEKAQIADMIRRLENGLDTEIWDKWLKLSWWERQRLAIARIFLKDPKIIILDEPTSALDSISEAKITKALDELTKNKTSIIIAHRLQTVMYADKIIVLENWKIEKEWLHSQLLKTSKIYKTLVDLQNGLVGE